MRPSGWPHYNARRPKVSKTFGQNSRSSSLTSLLASGNAPDALRTTSWARRTSIAADVRELTVNKQSPAAVTSYEARGFRTAERLEANGQGEPCPLPRMELADWLTEGK